MVNEPRRFSAGNAGRIPGSQRKQRINAEPEHHSGFFFLPISIANELISLEKCSEMDIILDLWLSAVYNDTQVQGSFAGPVAYFRNGSGCPLISYSELSQRWGISKATVGRVLKKLVKEGYISMLTFPGRHGTAIYLQNYLSTMFQVSDVMVDKEEVAMSLNIRIQLPDEADHCSNGQDSSVTKQAVFVSKSSLELIAAKVLKILEIQGIACSQCSKSKYKLYPLSDDCRVVSEAEQLQGKGTRLRMELFCSDNTPVYTFELTVKSTDQRGGTDND